MKKFIATVVATGLLFAGAAAAPAGAETLYRSHGHKVTITAKAATPAGALITRAKVTVKKGKKTVARNNNFYKAKKGTYKVTSTVSYFFSGFETYVPGVTSTSPATTATVDKSDLFYPECKVESRWIANDRTFQKISEDWSGGLTAYYTGPVTVGYTGTCFDSFNVNGAWQRLTWLTSWTEEDYVAVYDLPIDHTPEQATAAKLAGIYTQVGESGLTSSSTMTALPTYTVPSVTTTTPGHTEITPASAVTTVKSVRTVRVK